MTEYRPHLTVPDIVLLRSWGRDVYLMFGEMPYNVGSSLDSYLDRTKPGYRDVDVRVMLDAERWAAFADPTFRRYLHLAVSLWGRQVTGLPIDFQVQLVTEANDEFGHRPRNPIALIVKR